MSNIWVVVDHSGRRFVGDIIRDEGGEVEIQDPLLASELIREPPRVDLQVQPLWHSFHTNSVTVKWTHKHVASPQLVNIYLDLMSKIRAARAGIQIANKLPTNLQIVKN